MSLTLQPIDGASPERLYVYDGGRRMGRISKVNEDLWYWGIDWFAIGQKLLAVHRDAPEQGTAAVKRMWEFVTRSGVEVLSKGHSPSRDEALEDLEAAWRYVQSGGQGAAR